MNHAYSDAKQYVPPIEVPGPNPGTFEAVYIQLGSLIEEVHELCDRASEIETGLIGFYSIPEQKAPGLAVPKNFIDRANDKLAELRGLVDRLRSSLVRVADRL